MPKVDLREAHVELEDELATWCRTCKAPAEEGSPFCRPCRWYWEDVADGLYDAPDGPLDFTTIRRATG